MILSIVVPVFNCRSHLRETILSVLREGLQDTEIIVVDDVSTDGSLETIGDLPVTIVRRSVNGGPAAARNSGLTSAKGKLLAFLDANEILVEGGMRWRLEWLLNHPEERAVMGSVAGVIDEAGNEIVFPEILVGYERAPDRISLEYVRRRGFVFASPLNTLMLRADLLAEVGPFDGHSLSHRGPEDIEFVLRMLTRTSTPFFQRPTVFFRVSSNSGSVMSSAESLSTPVKLAVERRLVEMAYGLPPIPLPMHCPLPYEPIPSGVLG